MLRPSLRAGDEVRLDALQPSAAAAPPFHGAEHEDLRDAEGGDRLDPRVCPQSLDRIAVPNAATKRVIPA